MAEEVKFDLEPFIRDAVEKVHVEVDRRLSYKVAAELVKLGWVCIPPTPNADEVEDSQ